MCREQGTKACGGRFDVASRCCVAGGCVGLADYMDGH